MRLRAGALRAYRATVFSADAPPTPIRTRCVGPSLPRRVTTLVALLAGIVACGDEAVFDVDVPFRFGAGDCAAAGVKTVRGALYDFDGQAAVAQAEADCSEGRLHVPGVPAGTYSVVLEGLDERPCVTHAARLDEVRVGRSSTSTSPLRLGLAPRPVELRWHLPAGVTCASVGLRQVEVVIHVGDVAPAHAVFLCEADGGVIPSVPAGPAHIVVLGLDVEGTSIARGEADYGEGMLQASACDPRVVVDVALEGCASAGCP